MNLYLHKHGAFHSVIKGMGRSLFPPVSHFAIYCLAFLATIFTYYYICYLVAVISFY